MNAKNIEQLELMLKTSHCGNLKIVSDALSLPKCLKPDITKKTVN